MIVVHCIKKRYVPCLLLLLWNPVTAQSFYFGPKIGFNTTHAQYADKDYLSNNNYNLKSNNGREVGIAVGWSKYKYLSLHTELLYASNRYTIERTSENFMQNDITMYFLQLPVLFRFTAGSSKLRWHINMGPAISLWLSGEGDFFSHQLAQNAADPIRYTFVRNEEAPDNNSNRIPLDTEKDNILHAGLMLGTGVSFHFSRHLLSMVEIRYYYGQSYLGYNPEKITDDNTNNERIGRLPGFVENFENSLRNWSLSFYLLGAVPTVKGYLNR